MWYLGVVRMASTREPAWRGMMVKAIMMNKTITILVVAVAGVNSPYPTVVIVTTTKYNASCLDHIKMKKCVKYI